MRAGGPRLLFDRLFGVDPSVANEDVMGTIPQALFLMNGPIVNNRIQARPGTRSGRDLEHGPEPPRRLGRACTCACSRASPPKRKSKSAAAIWAAVTNQAEAFEDIYWSLINSTEFLTRR